MWSGVSSEESVMYVCDVFFVCLSVCCPSVYLYTVHVHVYLLQDSGVFCSIELSEYIADLWKNPNPHSKQHLERFENVSHVTRGVC